MYLLPNYNGPLWSGHWSTLTPYFVAHYDGSGPPNTEFVTGHPAILMVRIGRYAK